MTPLISILVPTYNRAGLIADALQSAIAQTYSNVEIIVVDDASPDDTRGVVAAFAAADARVRYHRHEVNLGIVGNWRASVEMAKGEFFCILHDDDTIEPTFVEELAAPLISDASLAISFSDHWVMDLGGRRQPGMADEATTRFKRDVLRPGRLTDFARSALVDCSVPVGATLFRTAVVLAWPFDPRVKGSLDIWLFYGCVKSGGGAHYCNKRLMNYRAHPGGMSACMPEYMAEGHLFRYERMLGDPEMAAIHEDLRRIASDVVAGRALDLVAQGRRGDARSILRRAGARASSTRWMAAKMVAGSGGLGSVAVRWARRVKRACRSGTA